MEPERGGGEGGKESHMKGAGMLVISLRGVIFGFWSHFECSGQSAIIFCHKYNTLGLHVKKCKKIIYKLY